MAGDQIYADDVSAAMLPILMLRAAGRWCRQHGELSLGPELRARNGKAPSLVLETRRHLAKMARG